MNMLLNGQHSPYFRAPPAQRRQDDDAMSSDDHLDAARFRGGNPGRLLLTVSMEGMFSVRYSLIYALRISNPNDAIFLAGKGKSSFVKRQHNLGCSPPWCQHSCGSSVFSVAY